MAQWLSERLKQTVLVEREWESVEGVEEIVRRKM